MLNTLEVDRTRVEVLEAEFSKLEPSLYAYPVLTLPNEIVSEIFIHFLPIYPLCPPASGPYSPTLLTRICHKWREIALANPLLWRAILLSNDIPREHQLHMCKTWLSRARACPLSIHIDDNNDPMPVSEIFAALSTHCAYWEHLKVKASFLPAIEFQTPFLRHLDLSLPRPLSHAVHAFTEAHLLRTVILNSVTSNIILPWAQLTSLTLTSIFPHECLPILQKTSTLVHCDLRLFSWPCDPTDITLPHLESLALGFPLGQGPDMMGFIHIFTVPALHSLQISEQSFGPRPIDSLVSFLSKSGCKLQELRIMGERSVTQKSYREKFPSIGTLSFSHDDEEGSDVETDLDVANSPDIHDFD
ncbi:hypothetical protein B0H13DRAFT_301159 [Mycena leptocephala]|nr:hypothetical protein B0H13DRAFT_301159 [Mycena leptocephala]